MYLGDMTRTKYSHLHGLEAQKHPLVFKVIRFIYGAPRFGIRESGGLHFLIAHYVPGVKTGPAHFVIPHLVRTLYYLHLRYKNWRS